MIVTRFPLLRLMATLLGCLALFLLSLTYLVPEVDAQSCFGSGRCCEVVYDHKCSGNGQNCVTNSNCPLGQTCQATPSCIEYSSSCTTNASNQCYMPCCPGCTQMSSSCSSCQAGTIFCGALNTCCPNTNTCNYWASQGSCAGGSEPDPGDPSPPVNPPSCTPRSSGWTNSLPTFNFTAGGTSSPNWDPVDARFFLRTDNTDGSITINWSQPGQNIDTVEYRWLPYDLAAGQNAADSLGQRGCDNNRARCGTMAGNITTYDFQRPREYRHWRLRMRFRHNCQGIWSAWREEIIRVDGQVSGQVYILDAGASATQTGLNGACSLTGTATPVQNSSITVTATGGGYTYTDPLISATTGRYRTFLPYQNPGAVTVGLNNLPAGYSVSCPVGGTYNSGNSTIPAPFLNNGTTGTMVNADFYLCNAGTPLTAPTAANITAPTQNQAVTPTLVSGQYRINLNFTKPSTGLVEYRLRPAGTPAGQECTATGTSCGTIPAGADPLTATTSFIPTQSAYVLDIRYTWTACGSTQVTAWSPVRNFTVVGSITGTIYEDPQGLASGNYCSAPPGLTQSSAGSITTSYAGASSNRVGGAYTLVVPWGSGTTGTVAYSDGTTVCGCPGGCSYSGVPRIATGVNFYRTATNDAWWQMQGGPVMALGDTGVVIQSYIPTSCTAPSCQPYLIRRSGGAGTSGYVVTGQTDDLSSSGDVDLRLSPGIDSLLVDQDGNNIIANTNPSVVREVYAEFIRRYKFTSERLRQNDFDGQSGRPNASGAAEPTHTPRNGVNAYWTSSDVTINQNWNITSGESRVIFIDGDLTIDGQINVAVGGFLAFIVSGDITVDPDIGTTPATVAGVVEGVYIADGMLNFPSRSGGGVADLKFVGEGTFVGWSGVSLDRDYNDGNGGPSGINNNTYPTEFFIYRPDFLLNAPEEMARPRFVWREVAP